MTAQCQREPDLRETNDISITRRFLACLFLGFAWNARNPTGRDIHIGFRPARP